MNITKPIIRKIKDNETALAEFEKEIKTNEAEDAKDIIMNFPTVYIHNWPETNKYDVYVGESNNIFARTRQHYHNRIKHETWQYRMMKTDSTHISEVSNIENVNVMKRSKNGSLIMRPTNGLDIFGEKNLVGKNVSLTECLSR